MCAIECSDYQGDEYSAYQYPAATWLKFEAKGKISDNTLGSVWQQINNEFLPSSKFHKGPLPTIEKYVLWNDGGGYLPGGNMDSSITRPKKRFPGISHHRKPFFKFIFIYTVC